MRWDGHVEGRDDPNEHAQLPGCWSGYWLEFLRSSSAVHGRDFRGKATCHAARSFTICRRLQLGVQRGSAGGFRNSSAACDPYPVASKSTSP